MITDTFYPLSVRFPAELYEAALAQAKAEDRSLASLVRQAVIAYLREQEPAA
jgi:hypothetical protein